MIKVRNQVNPTGSSYSQNFEDIISMGKILEMNLFKNKKDFWIMDIGASDGITLSNSRIFVEDGFPAILIDTDEDRFARLTANSLEFDSIVLENIEINKENTIHRLLSRLNLDIEIGLLSIDVDGPDMLILNQAMPFNPKVVIIEFNPTIPLHISFSQKEYGQKIGNSAKAIFDYLIQRNYVLFYATQTNLLFNLRNNGSEKSFVLEHFLDDSDTSKGIWTGYDGAVHFEGSNRLSFPWHGLNQRIRISGVPKYFQHFFGGGSKLHKRKWLWSKIKPILIYRDQVIGFFHRHVN